MHFTIAFEVDTKKSKISGMSRPPEQIHRLYPADPNHINSG